MKDYSREEYRRLYPYMRQYLSEKLDLPNDEHQLYQAKLRMESGRWAKLLDEAKDYAENAYELSIAKPLSKRRSLIHRFAEV